MSFGLYQGDKLNAAVERTYTRLLQDAFLPRLNRRIEDLLRAGAQNPEQLYEALKAYLMLYDPARMEPDAFKRFVIDDWETNLAQSLPASQRPAAEAHLMQCWNGIAIYRRCVLTQIWSHRRAAS